MTPDKKGVLFEAAEERQAVLGLVNTVFGEGEVELAQELIKDYLTHEQVTKIVGGALLNSEVIDCDAMRNLVDELGAAALRANALKDDQTRQNTIIVPSHPAYRHAYRKSRIQAHLGLNAA